MTQYARVKFLRHHMARSKGDITDAYTLPQADLLRRAGTVEIIGDDCSKLEPLEDDPCAMPKAPPTKPQQGRKPAETPTTKKGRKRKTSAGQAEAATEDQVAEDQVAEDQAEAATEG